jgi:hypothetical protein
MAGLPLASLLLLCFLLPYSFKQNAIVILVIIGWCLKIIYNLLLVDVLTGNIDSTSISQMMYMYVFHVLAPRPEI